MVHSFAGLPLTQAQIGKHKLPADDESYLGTDDSSATMLKAKLEVQEFATTAYDRRLKLI
jgi:hypothetical protein